VAAARAQAQRDREEDARREQAVENQEKADYQAAAKAAVAAANREQQRLAAVAAARREQDKKDAEDRQHRAELDRLQRESLAAEAAKQQIIQDKKDQKEREHQLEQELEALKAEKVKLSLKLIRPIGLNACYKSTKGVSLLPYARQDSSTSISKDNCVRNQLQSMPSVRSLQPMKKRSRSIRI
jgi:ribosomal protein S12 methylthiotransferase accessory factor YcaO